MVYYTNDSTGSFLSISKQYNVPNSAVGQVPYTVRFALRNEKGQVHVRQS